MITGKAKRRMHNRSAQTGTATASKALPTTQRLRTSTTCYSLQKQADGKQLQAVTFITKNALHMLVWRNGRRSSLRH